MPPELLNINEISDILKTVLPEDGHSPLLAALNFRYPKIPFRLLQENSGRTWDVGIIDAAGNRVADKLGKWIDQEMVGTGGSAKEVWNKHKNGGLIRTERVGSKIVLTAPYGPDPDQFYQLEILHGPELSTQLLFDSKEEPEDRQDLLSGPCFVFGDNERIELSPSVYVFEKLTNVRRFLRELVDAYKANRQAQMPELGKKTIRVQDIILGPEGGQSSKEVPFLDLCPDWLDRVPGAYRLFQDWSESSAGQGGNKFCDHWLVETNSWKEKGGSRAEYSLIPQWAEADGGLSLPEIQPDWDASPYIVMESLLQFDRQVGYEFAWYFYMLHGNRVGHSAGGVIANATKDGLLNLPKCDETVLLRWREDQYGF